MWQKPFRNRVPTTPWKPGKITLDFPVIEISWNFKQFKKYYWKMGANLEKWKISVIVHTLVSILSVAEQYSGKILFIRPWLIDIRILWRLLSKAKTKFGRFQIPIPTCWGDEVITSCVGHVKKKEENCTWKFVKKKQPGNIMEKSWNFVITEKWEPCRKQNTVCSSLCAKYTGQKNVKKREVIGILWIA